MCPVSCPSTNLDLARDLLGNPYDGLQQLLLHGTDKHEVRHGSTFAAVTPNHLCTTIQHCLEPATGQRHVHDLQPQSQCHRAAGRTVWPRGLRTLVGTPELQQHRAFYDNRQSYASSQ